MRYALLVVITLAALSGFAQQSAQAQSGTQPDQTAKKGCLAVKPIGSHAVRNIMLFGVAGAIVSEQQYQVEEVNDYPARIGEKFHGNDLQTMSSTTKVVVLDKHPTPEDIHKACQ